jgi:hypothetical protein
MANYLLLRDNKQQGPLSLEHLIQLGLKPYDLVWVEGRSAAWRYPSEIDTLKPYSKAVEEQPYDRFFKKKQNVQNETSVVVTQDGVLKQPEVINYVKAAEEPARKEGGKAVREIVFPDEIEKQPVTIEAKHEKYIPKKTVFVTMPVHEMPVKKEEPVFKIQSSHVTAAPENSLDMETKYSQPLDEIKEMYVKKLQDRKQQSAQRKYILQSLKKAAAFLGIVAIGVLIGYTIRPKANQNAQAAFQPLPQKTEQQGELNSAQQNESANLNTVTTQETNSPQLNNDMPVNEPVIQQKPVTDKKTILADKKNNSAQEKKTIDEKNEPILTQTPQGTEIDPVTGERIKKTRSEEISSGENKESNSVPQRNIESLVSVKSNKYNKVAFGGIRNLQLTVTNDSKYALDNVMVELQYLKPSEQPLKTENIYFKSVAPNGSLTIRVPDTNRGINVVFRIIKVESKEFKNDMAGL